MSRTEETLNPILQQAREMDVQDPLRNFRDQFHIPQTGSGASEIYLVGNSLGLQPRRTSAFVEEELEKWRSIGVRGHFESEHPWMPYHEFLTPIMADLVGAEVDEVVMMNSLTVNLHLMMATFYRPTDAKNKILIEQKAFPSDHYAVESQISFHGYDPTECLVEVQPDQSTGLIPVEAIKEQITELKDHLALIMLPGVQYYTGQLFDIPGITRLANELEIPIGFDLAHAAGNVPLNLHDWNVDFAVWCTYKYLNSGPGSVGGCFVHRRHARETDKIRLAGWWGHDKNTRFEMKNQFRAIPTAEGWQVSNPPILSMAAIRASLEVFAEAGGMETLREKSFVLTNYLESRLQTELSDKINVITPSDPNCRGCQLSLDARFQNLEGHEVYERLDQSAVRVDWREPNVIRVAPVPLYNSFEDVARFVEVLKQIASQ